MKYAGVESGLELVYGDDGLPAYAIILDPKAMPPKVFLGDGIELKREELADGLIRLTYRPGDPETFLEYARDLRTQGGWPEPAV